MTILGFHCSQETEEKIRQIIHPSGLTPEEIVERLILYILRDGKIPAEILNISEEQKRKMEEEEHEKIVIQRRKAIASIKKHRKNLIGPPMTIEEIIAAKNEGRA